MLQIRQFAEDLRPFPICLPLQPPPPPPPNFIFFPNPPIFITFFDSRNFFHSRKEIQDKHKNKLKRKYNFLMFRRLQNNLILFFVGNTFTSNMRLRFDSKQLKSQVSQGVKGKTSTMNEALGEERAYKTNTSLKAGLTPPPPRSIENALYMDYPIFLQENFDPPFTFFSKISNPQKFTLWILFLTYPIFISIFGGHIALICLTFKFYLPYLRVFFFFVKTFKGLLSCS